MNINLDNGGRSMDIQCLGQINSLIHSNFIVVRDYFAYLALPQFLPRHLLVELNILLLSANHFRCQPFQLEKNDVDESLPIRMSTEITTEDLLSECLQRLLLQNLWKTRVCRSPESVVQYSKIAELSLLLKLNLHKVYLVTDLTQCIKGLQQFKGIC